MDGDIEVRRATDSELAEIWQLTHDEYLRRGYIEPQPGGVFSHYTHLEWIPETTQLVAIVDGDIVGTCTYTLDSERKLHTDEDYPHETQIVRSVGVKMASSWRIVTDSKCRVWHNVARQLMFETAKELVEIGCHTVLCTFHPRHAAYYMKRLGFKVIASKSETKGLADAPSVLMIGGVESYERLAKSICKI